MFHHTFFNKLYLLLLVSICTASCKKFVQLTPPDNLLLAQQVFSDDYTATAAVTGIYGTMLKTSALTGPPPNITFNCGLSSDELINYSTDATQIQFYTNNLSSNTSLLGQVFWGRPYNYIYQANAILENLAKSTNVSNPVKNQLTGEAKFIRAFCFFYLTNMFGDIPIPLTSDYNTNNSLVRFSQSDVYDQIIKDLQDAQSLLSSDYSFSNGERTRPNKWAATALLARAYLYNKDYKNAEAQATLVINESTTYNLVNNPDSVFLANSREAIWQLQAYGLSNINTFDGNRFILTAKPTYVALSNSIVSSFESGDIRRTKWVKSITTGGNTYYYPTKYKVKTNSIMSEYLMVLRLGEQFLIRSEARAQQNELNDGVLDLNVVRQRAGLDPLADSLTGSQADVLNAIMHEREVELFTEWGHRWMDLKRTDQATGVLSPIKTLWKPTAVLYPIPQSEIVANPKLLQNLGYN